MCTKRRTQSHFAGMAGYSVDMSSIHLPGYTFALMVTLGVCKVCSSKTARSKPKIKEENEPVK